MTAPLDASAVARQIDALMARMSLEHKLGQMMQPERMAATPDDVATYHLGSILSGGGSTPGTNQPADWIAMNDAYWAASMSDAPGRVPIPLLYGVDAIHGHANVLGATVFPHNIGLGAMRDPDTLERVAEATAREILATGVEWTFAPTLAVARDIRWGRTYESYSDDTALVASYAGRFVRGLQRELGRDGVIACAKHFVGDGGTTNGRDQGDTVCSEEELTRIHLAPYIPALEAGVLTVMASFNSWNGDKCHGHRGLLTDVLKGRMGFDGFVISDWDGIDYLSKDPAETVALGVNAGLDMLMVSVEWKRVLSDLKAHVDSGVIPMSRIDDAVRRILSVKIRYGLFDRPRPAERYWSLRNCVGAPEHRDIAREAVRKSLVLLKNDGAVLPVDRSARILVAGRSADNRGYQCGGFTVAWQGVTSNAQIIGGTSIWEGIQRVAPHAVLSLDGSAADAGAHDVAIVVCGETPYAEGMGDIRAVTDLTGKGSANEQKFSSLAPYGQSVELGVLHPEDLALITAVKATGVPVVVVLVSGRPLVTTSEMANASAFVAVWLPGSEGQGVADVLFGDFDFQGTLPFAWPAAAAPGVAGAAMGELLPRGFGLTYAGVTPA